MFLMNFGGAEIALIAVVIVLLFGSSQLPKLARALGESKRALKEGLGEKRPEVSKPTASKL